MNVQWHKDLQNRLHVKLQMLLIDEPETEMAVSQVPSADPGCKKKADVGEAHNELPPHRLTPRPAPGLSEMPFNESSATSIDADLNSFEPRQRMHDTAFYP